MTVKDISYETVESKVREVIANVLCVSKDMVTPDATLDELGADSLFKIDIVMALEEIYEMEISEEEAVRCQTLQSITAMIGEKAGQS